MSNDELRAWAEDVLQDWLKDEHDEAARSVLVVLTRLEAAEAALKQLIQTKDPTADQRAIDKWQAVRLNACPYCSEN
jgi:hypothetical protein